MKAFKSLSVIIVVLSMLLILQSLTSVYVVEAEEMVYIHDQVIEVNITMDENDYDAMIADAINEPMYMADIVYNGVAISSVGIRPKGNSSLNSVVKSNGDRFSYKIDFDEYIDEQSLYGLDQMNLNNIYSDPSMMAEYLTYEALDSIGAVTPDTTFVQLSINGELRGLYLAVEEVDESFLIENYGDINGALYKPEMGGGADLKPTDELSSMIDKLGVFDDTSMVQTLIDTLEQGGDLSEIFNVDSFLKYLAVSTIVVHLDSYQGGMFHNYYLYENGDIIDWIGWDYNMSFNGFPKSNLTFEQATTFLIDEPVSGRMNQYPLVEAVLNVYSDEYHTYLETLLNSYFSEAAFTQRVTEVYQMIDAYVQADPTAFYSYESFKDALFGNEGLVTFMNIRRSNIEKQLSGELPSTNNGAGNVGAKIQSNERPQGEMIQDKGTKPEGGPVGLDKETVEVFIDSVGIENIPEEILERLQAGTLPPREMMDEFLQTLTEEQKMLLMSQQGPRGENGVNNQGNKPVQGNQNNMESKEQDDRRLPEEQNRQQSKPEVSEQLIEETTRPYLLYLGMGGVLLIVMFMVSKIRR